MESTSPSPFSLCSLRKREREGVHHPRDFAPGDTLWNSLLDVGGDVATIIWRGITKDKANSNSLCCARPFFCSAGGAAASCKMHLHNINGYIKKGGLMSRRRESYGAVPAPPVPATTAGHITYPAAGNGHIIRGAEPTAVRVQLPPSPDGPTITSTANNKWLKIYSYSPANYRNQTTFSEMLKKLNVGIWLVILTAVVHLLMMAPVDAQRTTTVTRTTTSTITNVVTSLSNVVCAKLVNVTGVCRRRRGLPIDEPVVLTFDEQLEEAVDQAFYHALHPGQFVPTTTLGFIYYDLAAAAARRCLYKAVDGVEVTPLVLLPVMTHSADDYYDIIHPLPAVNAVQPSMLLERPRYSGRNKMNNAHQQNGGGSDDDIGSSPESRIYFAQIAAIANAIANVFRPPVTLTTTVTAITTQVSTFTTFRTTSFFVMGCTPKPFPFSVCAGKRSGDISSDPADGPA
ncbi:hypothetical protein DAPPUDRAFT_101459 [Daphnia pulex]|uniref:Uncharacterized protein n=1 Tax=Daphnia pulex TaxID=6669 RepID=E9GDF4_DAPPU|nr:hypothetical protein DAPPUDRAFT_101459 [Daphnia pulex]|eukprot:EFX82074.1 hypothetical protein DAPPUDRAFT_101459 [Daphnia pulex]